MGGQNKAEYFKNGTNKNKGGQGKRNMKNPRYKIVDKTGKKDKGKSIMENTGGKLSFSLETSKECIEKENKTKKMDRDLPLYSHNHVNHASPIPKVQQRDTEEDGK